MATASSGPIVLLFPTFIRTTWTCIFLVHSNLAGLMIGKGGDRIAALRRDFNVQVQLAKPPEGQYDEEVTFSGKLEDVASAVNILNDAFRIYYSDQPVEDQQRAQIEAARRGDNYHTCKEGMKGAMELNLNLSGKGKGKQVCSPMGPQAMDLGGAISSCPSIPLERQQLRSAMIQKRHDYSGNCPRAVHLLHECPSTSPKLPSGMDPAAFIGKGGGFMKELKATCCRPGVGYIKRMHLEQDDEATQKAGSSVNRIDFQATEGIFPHAIAQIFERFRVVERNMVYYQNKTSGDQLTGAKGSPNTSSVSEQRSSPHGRTASGSPHRELPPGAAGGPPDELSMSKDDQHNVNNPLASKQDTRGSAGSTNTGSVIEA